MKKYLKFETVELVPVVVTALTWAINGFCVTMYNIALKGPFKDLQGIVNPYELDDVDIALIESLEDPLSNELQECILRIDMARDSLCNLNCCNWKLLFNDSKLRDKASKFLHGIVIFPEQDELTDEYFNAELYVESLLCAIFMICKLLKGDKIKLIRTEEDFYSDFFVDPELPFEIFFKDRENANIKPMLTLAQSLITFYTHITDWEGYLEANAA